MTHGERQHNLMAADVDQYLKDQELINAHCDEWLNKKGKIWIGVLEGDIVVEARNIKTFRSKIAKKNIDKTRLAVAKLGAPRDLIPSEIV